MYLPCDYVLEHVCLTVFYPPVPVCVCKVAVRRVKEQNNKKIKINEEDKQFIQ